MNGFLYILKKTLGSVSNPRSKGKSASWRTKIKGQRTKR